MKVRPVPVVVFLLAAAAAFGQSTRLMDSLLAAEAVSVGQASYLVLVASDRLGADAGLERAFKALEDLGWAPKGAAADRPIKAKEFSFMLMKAFGLPGGLMYSLAPCPRYAYRQLVADLVIQGRSDPDMRLTGYEAIRILGRALDLKGARI